MKIIIENNKIQIGSYIEQKSNTAYTISGTKDCITFRFNDGIQKKVFTSETTVNGVQMTPDNIDELLSPLFSSTGGNGGGESAINPQNQAYTKSEYSDPLVFPAPTRSGHIVEFYKGSVLDRSYQWNGWTWLVLGTKPNFVFRSNMNYTESDLSNYTPWFKDDSVYSLNVKADSPASFSLMASSIIENEVDSFLVFSADIALDNLCKEIERLEKIETGNYNSPINIHYAEGQTKETVQTKKFYLQKTSSTGGTTIDLEGTEIYIDNIKTGTFTEKLPSLDASGTSVNISKSNTSQAYLKIYSSSASKLKLSDNNLTTLNLTIKTKDTTTSYDTDLDITGNSGLSEINISGASNYKGSVLNGVFDFDETSLKTMIINAVKFSDQALDALIIALTSKTYSQSGRTFKMTPSLLIQEQVTKLTGKGWAVK